MELIILAASFVVGLPLLIAAIAWYDHYSGPIWRRNRRDATVTEVEDVKRRGLETVNPASVAGQAESRGPERLARPPNLPRYLVVAHQTAVSPELVAKLRELASANLEASFVLLVPATPVEHLLTWVEGETQEVARQRASDAASVLTLAAINVVEAVVGPADPLQAIREECESKHRPYALAIISTLPAGLSRWLKRDLADRVQHELGIPVIQVTAEASARAKALVSAPR